MNYVVSDIHGRYGHLMKLLDKINFNERDTLYILGDIIDRGPDVLKTIDFVMRTPNIKMLLGNHEDMMINYYESGLTYDRKLWYSNGGEATDNEFKLLSNCRKNEIFEYFLSLPLEYNLNINNKKYKLVHGFYVDDSAKKMLSEEEYKYCLIWGRPEKWYKGPKGYTVIFGHTCMSRRENRNQVYKIWKQNNLICIDCGLAYYELCPEYSRLGCICLDNLEEYYADWR